MIYKGYRVVGLGTFPVFEIKPQSTGKIPKALQGMFTTKDVAFKQIDSYLNSLKRGRKPSST